MIPKRIVKQVLERDGCVCMIGGPHCSGTATVADHRWNRGSGGNPRGNVPENLVAACGICNGEKESNPDLRADCRHRGIALETHYPPADFLPLIKTRDTDFMLQLLCKTPVVDPAGDVWYLTPNGRRVTPEAWQQWLKTIQDDIPF